MFGGRGSFFSSEFAILALFSNGFLVYRNCATMSAHPGNSVDNMYVYFVYFVYLLWARTYDLIIRQKWRLFFYSVRAGF